MNIDYLFNKILNYNILLNNLLKILSFIFGAIIIYQVVKIIIKRVFSINFKSKKFKNNQFIRKRQKTIEKIILSLWRYFTYFITLLIILSNIGVNIETILTGAGILGVIFAVGSQNLLQDFLEGFFNVFEDNISVSDYVAIDDVEGNIIDIGLRTIKIKSYTGEVHIIPNSKIGHIINYSLEDGKAILDVSIDYDSNLDKVLDVIKITLNQIKARNDNIISTPIIMGVNNLDPIGYKIRIMCHTKSETHWSVQRFMLGELIKSFAENKINIGMNQILIKNK